MPSSLKCWGLMLAPQCAGVTTKTGELDVSVMVGDVARPWLHEVLRHMLGSTVSLGPAVFQLPVRKYETLFEKACKWLKLPLRVTPPTVGRAMTSAAAGVPYSRFRSVAAGSARNLWYGTKKRLTFCKLGTEFRQSCMRTSWAAPSAFQTGCSPCSMIAPENLEFWIWGT